MGSPYSIGVRTNPEIAFPCICKGLASHATDRWEILRVWPDARLEDINSIFDQMEKGESEGRIVMEIAG